MPALLIIETSTEAASIALAVDGEIIEERSFTSDRRHNSLLFSPLAEIVKIHGSSDFDAVLVGSGPGSYSGTRVGIAAAQGAALVSACKATAIPSILATAEAVSGEKCIALGDARRGSFWLANIEGGHLISGPELLDDIALEATISAAGEKNIPMFCMDKIRGKNTPLSLPTATGLWRAWQNATPKTRALWAGAIPQPIYLKPPHITPGKQKTHLSK
ncbi:tRNA (adenosine(37)-N6)-threonylcarbamoyltransferase complex dimerization subunit type 1 TsaB [Luteolibacter sp. AS25]|uniref:tRNA (adenosine(37)-N6)-threonylcarbamoyltransferase complex dimerization subunit type 1 TsaB n=1 Tax=Luteolibacter sp. AS25 TaxID=3135776 RepID=UPI00398AF79F